MAWQGRGGGGRWEKAEIGKAESRIRPAKCGEIEDEDEKEDEEDMGRGGVIMSNGGVG